MPRATKSSLVDHRFPAFYACYLLRSVRTPKATATYIGSTPSPPRRIRQHNGIISQGAWKTKHNRPWVMQMIVQGFPSKLAALQFEWAWQHPHISRHLRDNDGQAVFTHSGKFKYLTTNVKVARNMVSSHPYNTWPLSVKLFTEEAEKAWVNAGKATEMPTLPVGVKVVTELEGVDGKSGKPGSGRTGPIDVSDAHFTTEHLRKGSLIFVPDRDLRCSICHDAVQHDGDPLATALCPTTSCTAVSHLTCLSRHFLAIEASSSSNSDIIPRGGRCASCNAYILWGDVVRGCYRRREGGVNPEAEQDDADELEGGDEDLRGQLFGDHRGDEDEAAPPPKSARSITSRRTTKQSKARAVAPSASRPAQFSTLALAPCSSSDEREPFDLDNISSCSSDEQDSNDGRPQWHSFLPSNSAPSSQGSVPPKATPVYPRPNRLRDSEDHRGPPPSSHAPASYAQTAVGAEGPSRGKMCHGAVSRDPAHKTSRKPRSADMAGTRAVDPLLSAPGVTAGGVPDRGSSCPPSGTVARDSRRPLEIARAALGKPSLRPFPDMPPLSQPLPMMNDRRPGGKAFDNEVVEISSD
ncbi:hypothetical protein LXA43DRAFT_59068 [Ganoderma leucocontextum]|nr:hypothetical protein LXA43DRAFT_59068 [Ganoderma leucocontextum]